MTSRGHYFSTWVTCGHSQRGGFQLLDLIIPELKSHVTYNPAYTYLQIPLWQWGASNVYLLVLFS